MLYFTYAKSWFSDVKNHRCVDSIFSDRKLQRKRQKTTDDAKAVGGIPLYVRSVSHSEPDEHLCAEDARIRWQQQAAIRWQREGLSNDARFSAMFTYHMERQRGTLSIHQSLGGIHSTVWDSSIVMSKFFEHASHVCDMMLGTSPFKGKSVLEVGAGCGLVGLALAKLGSPRVVLSDLEAALPLLKRNIEVNGCSQTCAAAALSWGCESALRALSPPFDYVIGADVMYIVEVIPLLVSTLVLSMDETSVAYFGYGRNRRALEQFLEATLPHFKIESVDPAQFHPDFYSRLCL